MYVQNYNSSEKFVANLLLSKYPSFEFVAVCKLSTNNMGKSLSMQKLHKSNLLNSELGYLENNEFIQYHTIQFKRFFFSGSLPL